METTEERVDKVEVELAQFMAQSKATIRHMDEMIERADRKIEQGERSYEELKEHGRKHTLEMAHIADRIGRFAEDIVAPNIPRIAEEAFGMAEIEFEAQRVKRRHSRDRSRMREFDVVLAGNRQLLVTSVKSTARNGDVRSFAEALKEIFDYFPEYRGYTVAPIFASMALSADWVRRLTRLKIYALALGERTMELLNLEQVRARPANGK